MATPWSEKETAPPSAPYPQSDDISPATSTRDLDDNYELYKNFQDVEIDPVEWKKVLRKVDLRIMPLLIVTYMLQYLDKNTINFASVYGLNEGTHLKGQDYSWLGVLLLSSYISYQHSLMQT
jgi:hypothetical protein